MAPLRPDRHVTVPVDVRRWPLVAGWEVEETARIWRPPRLRTTVGDHALGVGIEHAVDHSAGQPLSAPEGWLLVGSPAVTLVLLGVMLTAQSDPLRMNRSRAIPVLLVLTTGFLVRGRAIWIVAALAVPTVAQAAADVLAGDLNAAQ